MFTRYRIKIPERKNAPVHTSNLFTWIWFFIKPHKGLFFFLTLNRATRTAFFAGVEPLLIAKIIEAFEKGTAFKDPSSLWNIIWLLIALSSIVYFLLIICTEERKMADRVSRQARLLGIAHLNQLSAAWHEDRASGSKLQKIMSSSDALNALILLFYHEILHFFAGFLGIAFALWQMNVPFFYIGLFFGFMLTYTAFAWGVGIYLSKAEKTANKLKETLVGKIYDFINNSLTVKTFNLDRIALRRAQKEEQKGYKQASGMYAVYYSYWILQNFIALVWVVLILKTSIDQTLEHTLSITAFTLVAFMALRLWRLLEEFSDIYNRIIEQGSAFRRLIHLMRQPISVTDTKEAKDLVVKTPSISFNSIDFSYTRGRKIFRDFTLRIKAGERIGIVGESGSGKSTFVKLLLRFYDPTKNEITIDAQDIKTVTQRSLRKNISVIPQDVSIFNQTIQENIRYGRMGATEEEVIAAAKAAQAHDFIEELPHGYKTKIGEKGIKLSGGQRQRIAIARALLEQAPILVLDEATSSLDSKSEMLIQQSLTNLMKNKTVIAIAHRLSTIQNMDRLVVLDNGNIVEEGTHEELLKRKGPYFNLWEMQTGGFRED